MSQTDAPADASAARAALERLLETVDLALPDRFGDRVEAFVRLLLEANRRMNLTRIVEPQAVARLHLLDALSALPVIDELAPVRALDLGSGGGVPGIVLALARPAAPWTMVDSARRRADALRGFVSALELAGILVVAERAEVLGRDPAHRDRYDLVTARACAALPVLAEYALPFVRVGGAVLAWKGAITDEELRSGRAAVKLLGGELEVRPSGIAALGDHRFVLMRKSTATPDRYPRRPGEPARRPLGVSRPTMQDAADLGRGGPDQIAMSSARHPGSAG